jgi:hypothetical protein
MESFEMAAAQRSTTTEMVVSRQAQEVQAAMVIAKKFPRDYVASYNRIMQACQRKGLAEKATYEYPRGGQKVVGASIRLAEALAQNWGNIDYGIIELEQKKGESQVMAYAWDLETNTRQTKVFTVPHIRETKKGNIPLTDPRDIYEMVANQGARRVRACILGIIPGDVIEDAVEQCNRTLASGEAPLIDVIKQVTLFFQRDFNVSVECLEKYIGCKSEAFSMNDCIRLRKLYNSIKDGMVKREDVFDLALPVDESDVADPFATQKKDEKKKGDKKSEVKEDADGQQQLPTN